MIWLGMAALMVSSCGGSKKSSSIRQIEKHSKKYPIDENGNPINKQSKKVKQALAKQEKLKKDAAKEAEKGRQDAITRHRAFQTQETRDRMDQHLKESDKRYSAKKDFFLVRWFRPKDSVEKIEKRRAKEVQKRMAATRKQAEKNNKERNTSSFKTKERKSSKPDPNDVQLGGGGSYREGKSKNKVNPSDIQQGGGGSYTESKSKSKAKSSDTQQGGGGSYQKVKSKKK